MTQDTHFWRPLLKRLANFSEFTEEEAETIAGLSATAQRLCVGTVLIEEGDRPEDVIYLVEGWAARYKILPDGRRQIVAILIPGDLCDVQVFTLKEMDHSIALLSDAKVARIPKRTMLQTMEDTPRIARAMWWSTLVDEAVLREWLVNMGQRNAFERLAHLFCELWLRLKQVGLTSGHGFHLPLSQEGLADTMGLTPVHINRTLQRMREERLITLRSGELVIEDIERLQKIADFNPNYLHLLQRK
ncbi:Crp/Fnr family transcriptional regulator [Aurantiacibacter poecillastricola]|uniref:Crp/Fnr family transcriptional regulator n=1 Tax=Aurantiacibacter poecillastricola TaxID=3064385 RepID=UPI00273F7912|nr:Crp/Fnr family transcriptional regulator [Aurantiacibacter sp. 219JJ12-13]MDP5263237.1 Crp/Fnr family transcriptional regulator [Aurantiacibacter sp. 219JJ12-13]